VKVKHVSGAIPGVAPPGKVVGLFWFDPGTGAGVCNKTIDTRAAVYRNASSLLGKLNSYVDDLLKFVGSKTGDGALVTRGMVESWVLRVGIPDIPLTPAQMRALDDAKSYGRRRNVIVLIVVIK